MGGINSLWVKPVQDKPMWDEKILNLRYLRRKMNMKAEDEKKYYSHVFMVVENSEKTLKEEWEYINQYAAVHYQSKTKALIERSNFYICFFVKGNVEEELKEYIEGDTFCAKKYIFCGEEYNSELNKMIHAAENRIFALNCTALKPETYSNGNINVPAYVGKIELENFRRYSGKKEFSFISDKRSKKAASLVVIYAKNGDGKTSIFDAVEFALKGEVDRIKELIKRDKIDNEWKGAIYHNREHAKEEASVCIYLSNGRKIIRQVRSVADNHDDCEVLPVKEGSDIVEQNKSAWNQLILPHYRIDNFISARKPTDQYKEWCESVGLLEKEQRQFIETHRKLTRANDTKIELEKKIDLTKKALIKLEESRHQVQWFQQLILQYNEMSEEKVPEFQDGDGADKYDQLKNAALSQLYSCNENRAKIRVEKRKIEYIFAVGYDVCRENNKNIEKLRLERQELQEQLQRYRKLRVLSEQKKNAEKQVSRNSDIRLCKEIQEYGLETVAQRTEQYKKLLDEKNTCEIIIKKFKGDRKKIEQQKDYLVQINEDIAGRSKKFSIAERKLEEINNLRIQYDKNKIVEQTLFHSGESSKIAVKKQKQRLMEVERVRIPLRMEEWNGKIEIELFKYIGKRWGENVFYIRNRYEKALERKKLREEIIRKEQSAIAELTKVLEQGRTYISEHQEVCECPLCHMKFKSWNQLVYSMLDLQNENCEQVDEEIASINEEIKDIKERYEIVRQEGNKILRKKVEDYREQYLELEKKEENIKSEIQKCIEQNIMLQAEQQLYEEWFRQNEIILVDYEDGELNKRLADLQAEKQKNLQKIEKLEDKINTLNIEIEKYEKTKEENLVRINVIMNRTDLYGYIVKLLKKTKGFKVMEYLNSFLQHDEYLRSIIGKLEKEIETYSDVAQMDEEQLMNEMKDKRKVLEEKQRMNLKYAPFTEYSEKQLNEEMERIDQMDQEYAKKQRMLQKIKDENGAREYFEKFNQYRENLKDGQVKLREQEKKIEEQKAQFEKARDELEIRMKEYFDQELINEIYKKINPHEIMKEMKYELSFNDREEPQLIIKTATGKEYGDSYRPEGYFSTAQLNAIAFSCFLGSALKNQNMAIRSIFIDDPLDHFDDINILGFVDLIRSILESTDYQIIMSTHDEKAFRILQRKLSDAYYSSQFIRLGEDNK